MTKQTAFAKTEILTGDKWQEILFERLRPGDVMRTNNSLGKTYKVMGYPSITIENRDNWEVECEERE